MIEEFDQTKAAIERLESISDQLENRWKKLEDWPAHALAMACLRRIESLFADITFGRYEATQFEKEMLSEGFESVYKLLSGKMSIDGVPLFTMEENFRNASHYAVACGTQLNSIRKLIEMCRRGFVKASIESSSRIAIIIPVRTGAEYEDHQRALTFFRKVDSPLASLFHKLYGEIDAERLRSELRDNVYIWMDHYIGYTMNGYLDFTFTRIATPVIVTDPLFNFFDGQTPFGSFKFEQVQAVGAALVTFSIKHIHMASALANKEPHIQLIDLLCISEPLDRLYESIATFCDLDIVTVSQVLELFIWHPWETEQRYDWHTSKPPIIAFNDNVVVRPCFCFLTAPYDYALRKLNRVYTKDWDRACNTLEEGFRSELYDLFQGTRYYCSPKAKKIKVGGKVVTDIDAMVFDVNTGTLCLYQLKWQLPFWNGSLREHHSKRKNYLSSGAVWSTAVSDLIQTLDEEHLNEYFDIPRDRGTVRQIMGFVIGRFFSDFSNYDYESQDGVTWASWPHFVEAREHCQYVFDTQTEMAVYLMTKSTTIPPGEVPPTTIEETEIVFRKG